MVIKLWHDDCREPPDSSWTYWARANDKARMILEAADVDECSLDHDLGGHALDPSDPNTKFVAGEDEDNGWELVKWMLEEPKQRIPRKVTIHSWNSAGARRMAEALAEHTWVIIKPYDVDAVDLSSPAAWCTCGAKTPQPEYHDPQCVVYPQR